jgi:hypothetical protein
LWVPSEKPQPPPELALLLEWHRAGARAGLLGLEARMVRFFSPGELPLTLKTDFFMCQILSIIAFRNLPFRQEPLLVLSVDQLQRQAHAQPWE